MNFKTKRKNSFSLIFLICLLSSCNTSKKIVNADLSFSSISFTTAYGATKEQYNKSMMAVDSVIAKYEIEGVPKSKKSGEYQNYLLSKHIRKLDKLELYKLPHIYLYFGNDSIMEVHVSEKAYEKVKNFRQRDLHKENKKVLLKLAIEEKYKGIYYTDNIIEVKKVDGTSRSNVFKN